jgi:hypothetical protein
MKIIMNYQEYLLLFEQILNSEHPQPPYDKPNYLDYTKLNLSRMNRWMKAMVLDKTLVAMLKSIDKKQHWIIIVEPWCGDVAHSLPFLIRLAEQGPFITYELQLRDSEPFLINSYLTKGGKSIPKLIVRNEYGKDLFTWGPRPEAAQLIRDDLLASNADAHTINVQVQNWYNEDRGKSLQSELKRLLSTMTL